MTDYGPFNGDTVSDLKSSDVREARDLEAELFNRTTIKDMVTNFERELGINTRSSKKKNMKRVAELLAPGRDQDAEKLNAILNEDEKYRVVMWKDTWTAHGDYRVFLIYEEILEDKKAKK